MIHGSLRPSVSLQGLDYTPLSCTTDVEYSETPSLTRKRKFKLHREHSQGSDNGNDATNLILQQRARRRAATAEPGPVRFSITI
jgi:hypothetical protein